MKTDFVGEWEGIVDEAVSEASGLLKTIGKEVLNRPFGSEPVPLETRLVEWSLMRESPEALIQYADDQGLSDETMIKHFAEMERKYAKWNK